MEQTKTGLQKLIEVLKALLVSFLISAGLLLILSVFLWKGNLKEGPVSVGILVIYALSAFLGGRKLAGKMPDRKFLWGLLEGSLYFVILAGLSMILHPGEWPNAVHAITVFLISAGAGMAGGICRAA